jgi:uncharacterized iron-regulated membrane protein
MPAFLVILLKRQFMSSLHSPLDTGLVFTDIGFVFAISGWLSWREGRGARRRRLAEHPERRPHHMRELRPLVLGVVFAVAGVFLLILGLLTLLLLAMGG